MRWNDGIELKMVQRNGSPTVTKKKQQHTNKQINNEDKNEMNFLLTTTEYRIQSKLNERVRERETKR